MDIAAGIVGVLVLCASLGLVMFVTWRGQQENANLTRTIRDLVAILYDSSTGKQMVWGDHLRKLQAMKNSTADGPPAVVKTPSAGDTTVKSRSIHRIFRQAPYADVSLPERLQSEVHKTLIQSGIKP